MRCALLIYRQPGAAESLSERERKAGHRDYQELRRHPAVMIVGQSTPPGGCSGPR